MTTTTIKENIKEIFQLGNLHFFVIFSCLLMQMLNYGELYRLLAYVNLLLVMVYWISQSKENKTLLINKQLLYVIYIPLLFIAIHFIAAGNIVVIKEIRHIFLAIFLMIGIWILAKKNPNYIKKNIFGLTIILILIYVIIQAIALWWFNKPNGTTKNPHYLAMYSAASLIVFVFCFFKSSTKLKWLISLAILMLGIFLLHSSSRPTWIGLIFSSFFVLLFVNWRAKLISALSILTVLIGLSLTNVGNFSDRSEELLMHLSTEERVVIWQDAWRMQAESPTVKWVFGHGLDSFEDNFKQYSHYHLRNIDFNSPHNFFLELVYISGVVGLLLSIFMLWLIYRNLFINIQKQDQYKSIYLVLLVIITSNLILVSITLPFFSSYNLNFIAVVMGVTLYLKELAVKKLP